MAKPDATKLPAQKLKNSGGGLDNPDLNQSRLIEDLARIATGH